MGLSESEKLKQYRKQSIKRVHSHFRRLERSVPSKENQILSLKEKKKELDIQLESLRSSVEQEERVYKPKWISINITPIRLQIRPLDAEIKKILEKPNSILGIFTEPSRDEKKWKIKSVQEKIDCLIKQIHAAERTYRTSFCNESAVAKQYYDVQAQWSKIDKKISSLYSSIMREKGEMRLLRWVLDERSEEHEKEKHQQAKVASADNETRKLASTLRKQLIRRQLTDECPYCNRSYSDDRRLDHIMPVAMGGLSVEWNLVFVCLDCNTKKSDLTLREFCERYSLDRSRIETRLTELGKRC